MQKIINQRRYSTETATSIGVWTNNYNPSDFGYCREELYRKRNGEFFLYGEGGPQTKYAFSYGDNSWGSGESITPLSYEAAMKWAEDNLTAEEYESTFGEHIIDEDEEKGVATYRISDSTREIIKRIASKEKISIGEAVDKAVAYYNKQIKN